MTSRKFRIIVNVKKVSENIYKSGTGALMGEDQKVAWDEFSTLS